MTEIAGRVALVTGGGSGIGEGLARALAAEGASVAVADLWEDRSAAVAHGINQTGGSAVGITCDVSDRGSVEAARSSVTEALGPVSLLFANAGVTALGPLVEMAANDIDWIFAVDLHGVVHCLEAFLPDMVRRRDGHVVATSSMAGLIPESLAEHGPYAGAKAGLIGLMLNLRLELSRSGVGCTVLCPGGVSTRIGQSPGNRPDRFGGPSSGGVIPPGGIKAARAFDFRSAGEIAQMVLQAIRADRPIVVTDPAQREFFMQSYVEVVLSAFDDAARFDRERG